MPLNCKQGKKIDQSSERSLKECLVPLENRKNLRYNAINKPVHHWSEHPTIKIKIHKSGKPRYNDSKLNELSAPVKYRVGIKTSCFKCTRCSTYILLIKRS